VVGGKPPTEANATAWLAVGADRSPVDFEGIRETSFVDTGCGLVLYEVCDQEKDAKAAKAEAMKRVYNHLQQNKCIDRNGCSMNNR